MASKDPCIAALAEKYKRSEKEVAEIYDEITAAREAELDVDDFLKRRALYKKEVLNEAILNLRKETELNADWDRRVEQGIDEHAAALESFELSERGGEGAKIGLDSDIDTIKATLRRKFFQDLHDIDPDWGRTFRKLSDEDVLALRQELEEGPGTSGNKRMEALARPIRNVLDSVHTRAHRAGLAMQRIENYLPHQWDSKRVADFGKAAWVKRMKAHLDLKRTFPGLDSKQADEVLGKSWENIANGRNIDIETVGSPEMKRGSRNARQRAFHFKDAKNSHAATQAWGRKDASILGSVISYMDSMSRDIAVVERFGTTPRENVQRAATRAYNKSKNPKAKKLLQDFLNAPDQSKLGKALNYGLGTADMPLNLEVAQINRSIRAVLNTSKLGKATLASIVDLATAAHNLRFQGLGMFEAYGRLFKMIGHIAANRAEARQFYHHLAVGMDGGIASIHKMTIGDNLVRPGSGLQSHISRMETFFFKWSGLTGWTDTIRAAAARVTAEHIGAHGNKNWDSLSDSVKRLLKLYDVNAKSWEDMRTAWKKAGGDVPLDDGRIYMMPEHLQESGLDETLMRIYQGEADYAVVMSNAKTKRLMLQGHRPGTIVGEALRFMGQFRSFPTAISQKVLGRGWRQDKAGMALLMAQMWGWGYVAMTAKDYAAGKKRKKLDHPRTYAEAFMHGGVVGIYGDLLLGSMVHRGGSPLDQIAGPGMSEVVKLTKTLRGMPAHVKKGQLDRSIARIGKQGVENLPFANHFLLQGLLHYNVLNELTEMQNPGALRRRQRRMEEEYGQEYLEVFEPK